MGWGYGHNKEGREIGYSVEAKCDQDGCKADIDRGLAYVCGGMHDGDEHGCGKYFCYEHLHIRDNQLCPACVAKFDTENPDYWDKFEIEVDND